MEKCWDIGKKYEQIKNKDEREKVLKAFMKEMNKKLSIMRQLHLVHVDIKL